MIVDAVASTFVFFIIFFGKGLWLHFDYQRLNGFFNQMGFIGLFTVCRLTLETLGNIIWGLLAEG